MRVQGKITYWNDEKAYGFIRPASGKDVFFHLKAFRGDGRRPQPGQLVSFALSIDRQGRTCAVRVAPADVNVIERIHLNDRMFMIAGALLFLALLGLLTWSDMLPARVFALYLGVSLLTFVAYAMDKASAEMDRKRISEDKLHLFALIGGWPGAMVAQQVLRHKSMKVSFRRVFWLTVVLNTGFLIWLISPWGEELRNWVEAL